MTERSNIEIQVLKCSCLSPQSFEPKLLFQSDNFFQKPLNSLQAIWDQPAATARAHFGNSPGAEGAPGRLRVLVTSLIRHPLTSQFTGGYWRLLRRELFFHCPSKTRIGVWDSS